MKDYKKIVEALRHCSGPDWCVDCGYFDADSEDCAGGLMEDAAEAIEEFVKTQNG